MSLLPSTGAGISDIVEDTTPQLGGDLDTNNFDITSPDGTDKIDIVNGTIEIETNSTPRITITDTGVALNSSLSVNSQKIVSTSNGDIDIEPHGTGNVLLGNFSLNADQTVGAGQDNYVMTYDNATGLINLEAAAGGGLANVVEDLSPQLGADLDGNTFDILFDNATGILDDSSNEQLLFVKTASAVNYLTVTNAATGNNPIITAGGSDANIGINFQNKATGTYNFAGTADTAAEIRLAEDTDNGTHYIGLAAPASVAANKTFVLPAADGTNGQALTTNGSATLSFTTISGGIANVVEDTTPQLGGDLDLNGNQITSPDGTDLIDIPNGSIDLQTASTSRLDITDSGVRLGAAGARVTSITDSDTLGTSDTILCTQGNVKAYADLVTAPIRYNITTTARYIVAGGIAVSGSAGGTLVVTANRLYFVQLVLMCATNTWNQIGMEVTTLAAGNVRMGIYTNGVNNLPETLIIDAGTADTGTTGVKTIALNQSLDPGIYWLASVHDATPTVRRTGNTYAASSQGLIATNGTEGNYYYHAHTYGALPTTASALTIGASINPNLHFIKES